MAGINPKYSDVVVGIDLGTTNSSVAYYGANGMEIIPIAGEDKSMPSVVRFPDRKKEDIQVGRQAKNYIITKPEEVFSSFKTQMASAEWANDPEVKEKFTIEGEQLDPTFMASRVLLKLKEAAIQTHPVLKEKGDVVQAVICVPAQSEPTYINEVYKAAEMAGFGLRDKNGQIEHDENGNVKGVTVLEEPTAAAIAYGLYSNFFGGLGNKKQQILIYDFGGGTFDVTLLEIEGKKDHNLPKFTILAKGGDAHLGGDDLDWEIVKMLEKRISKQVGSEITESPEYVSLRSQLKKWAEDAKIAFSNDGDLESDYTADITVNGNDYHITEVVTKEDFLKAIQPLIDRSIETMKEVVNGVSDFDSINRVVLVGGSSKGPWIADAVDKAIGKKHYNAPDVDTYVALGAAYYGANLPGLKDPIDDILSFNYGLELYGGLYGLMLPKGMPFNGEKSLSKTHMFTNATDSGEVVLAGFTTGTTLIEGELPEDKIDSSHSIYETEDKTGKSIYRPIGEFKVKVPAVAPGKLAISITMSVFKEDKTLRLSGTVNGQPISDSDIIWKY